MFRDYFPLFAYRGESSLSHSWTLDWTVMLAGLYQRICVNITVFYILKEN